MLHPSSEDKKSLLYSIVIHFVCLLLVGALSFINFHPLPDDTIYDVALMGGGGGEPMAVPEEPEVEEEEEEEEEEIVPQEEDIVEKKEVPKPKKKKKIVKPVEKAPVSDKPVSDNATGGTGPGIGGGEGTGSGLGKGAGHGVGDGVQAPAVAPRVKRRGMVRYPEAARRQGIQGTPVIRFLVGKKGEVEKYELFRSSGNDLLDNAALKAAKGFRFRAGLDSKKNPIRCYAYQGITFRLR